MSPQVAAGALPAESGSLSFRICGVAWWPGGSQHTWGLRVLLSLSRDLAVEGFTWGEGRKKILKNEDRKNVRN